MQYLLAKVIPSPGSVRVEITADYTGNPTIENEAQAKARLDKGADAANVAVEMALLMDDLAE